jgi:hypothetical protein
MNADKREDARRRGSDLRDSTRAIYGAAEGIQQ